MDLKTGHGSADVRAAQTASSDGSRVLLTWQTTPRIVGPTKKMTAANRSVRATLLATTGRGAVLVNKKVDFTAADGGSVDTDRRSTSGSGRLAATFKSTAAGTVTTLTAQVASRSLSFDTYVLQRDDNVPGVRPRPSPFRGKLDPRIDIDDVFRIYLRDGETMRARLGGIDPRREYGDLFLHRGGTRDVTNPFLAPLAEPAPYDNKPLVLRRRVSSDGVRFLDVYGYGTYRLHWSIYAPNVVRRLSATPATFSPGSDGVRDVTRLSWRLARRGRVAVRVRNSAGRVVFADGLGRERRGERTWRWDGRNQRDRRVREGTYRVTVRWGHRTGRVSQSTTRVRVER
jgi:hypothetical protein